MIDRFDSFIAKAKYDGRFRSIPNNSQNLIDLCSNDYLAIDANDLLRTEFYNQLEPDDLVMSSCASRLLSRHQKEFFELENLLSSLYYKEILLYNSGYHANTGTVSAIAGNNSLIIADKLVHASIIDGLILGKTNFKRFKHNDLSHLLKLIEDNFNKYEDIFVIVESIYSMDGDICDLKKLTEIKKQYPNVFLYVDEAHGFGVRGNRGLGLCEETGTINDIDIIVGTLGKAIASYGAFVATNETFKNYLINKSRSFIFSTAIPPISCKWSKFVIEKMIGMTKERQNLLKVSEILNSNLEEINGNIRSNSQIVPLMAGSNDRAIGISNRLKEKGYLSLPIRKPTVPEGLERVRLSINAAFTEEMAYKLLSDIKQIL